MAKAIREVYGETIKKYGELNKDMLCWTQTYPVLPNLLCLEKSIRTVSITVVSVSTL